MALKTTKFSFPHSPNLFLPAGKEGTVFTNRDFPFLHIYSCSSQQGRNLYQEAKNFFSFVNAELDENGTSNFLYHPLAELICSLL